jgi:hypothetical protein
LEITVSIRNEEYINYVNKRIKSLIENNYNSNVDLEVFYKLLIIIKENESLFSIKLSELLQCSKSIILSKIPNNLDYFIIIIEFVQNIGIKINETEMVYLSEKLNEILNEVVDVSDEGQVFMYNPESKWHEHYGEIQEVLEKINKYSDILSGFYGISLESMKTEIEQKLEDYYTNYEPEDDYNREDEIDLNSFESEDTEIDFLFESLVDK